MKLRSILVLVTLTIPTLIFAEAKHDHAAKAEGQSTDSCCGNGKEETCCQMLGAYVPVSDALAADDLDKAKDAAATLAKQADAAGLKNIYQPALALIHANDIAAARTAFRALSKEVVPLAGENKEYVVMTCPMAKADWVQADAKVRNPYYGKSMLTCGSPKKS